MLCYTLFTFSLIVLFAFCAAVVCLAVPCLESRCVGGGEVAAREAVAWVGACEIINSLEAARSVRWGREGGGISINMEALTRLSLHHTSESMFTKYVVVYVIQWCQKPLLQKMVQTQILVLHCGNVIHAKPIVTTK